MVLQLDCFRVQRSRILTEEKGLHLDELDIRVLWLLATQRSRCPETIIVIWLIIITVGLSGDGSTKGRSRSVGCVPRVIRRGVTTHDRTHRTRALSQGVPGSRSRAASDSLSRRRVAACWRLTILSRIVCII